MGTRQLWPALWCVAAISCSSYSSPTAGSSEPVAAQSATARPTCDPVRGCDSPDGTPDESLRRPLQSPRPETSCERATGSLAEVGGAGGYRPTARGPVHALLGADSNTGVVAGRRSGPWWVVKTLWYSDPGYRGPVLIRGTAVMGGARVAFGGDRPSAEELFRPAGPSINQVDGYRMWPGGMWFPGAGCYMFQIDGTSFSETTLVRIR